MWGMRGWLIAGVLLVGCSGEPPASGDGVGEVVVAPERARRQVPETLYGPEGIPRESDVVIAGLTLPLGLTEVESLREERRHAYTSEVPVTPLLRYFGPRLTTVDITQESGRTVYRNSVPREVRGGIVHLDVTIRSSSAYAARVEIFERTPPLPEGTVISPEAIRRELEEQMRNRE